MSLDINIDQKSKLRNGKKSSHLWGMHGNTHRNDRRFFETRKSHATVRLQDYALNIKLDRLATKRGLT